MNTFSKGVGRFLIPSVVTGVYFFLYFPITILAMFSFNKAKIVYKWKGFTLDWYSELFESAEIWSALKVSLIVATVSVVLSLVMGVLLVWVFNKQFKPLLPLFYTTVMIPDVAVAVGLLTLFTMFYVPLGLTSLIAGHTLIGLGFVVPIVYARFTDLDYRLIEASLDLGATRWQTFFKVVLPLLKPALISAGLLVFIISLDDFLISFFCAGTESQTLSLYIFSMVRAGVSPLVNAMSVIMLIVSVVLVLVFSMFNKNVGLEHE